MITGAEIGFGIKALKTAFDIAKDAKDLTDTAAIRGKIIEMQTLIMEAQASAIDAREAHAAQIQQIRQLEEEMARLKAWDGEKKRYEMKVPQTGSTVYSLKADMRLGEPPHWLCANCYTQGKKSFLVMGGSIGRERYWDCANCESQIRINFGIAPT